MTPPNQHSGRVSEIRGRIEWCETRDRRPNVRRPQITNEWRNLLDDAKWLLEALAVANELDEQHVAECERLEEQLEAASASMDNLESLVEDAERQRKAAIEQNESLLRVVNAAIAYCSDVNNRGEAETDDLEAAIAALYPAKERP